MIEKAGWFSLGRLLQGRDGERRHTASSSFLAVDAAQHSISPDSLLMDDLEVVPVAGYTPLRLRREGDGDAGAVTTAGVGHEEGAVSAKRRKVILS